VLDPLRIERVAGDLALVVDPLGAAEEPVEAAEIAETAEVVPEKRMLIARYREAVADNLPEVVEVGRRGALAAEGPAVR